VGIRINSRHNKKIISNVNESQIKRKSFTRMIGKSCLYLCKGEGRDGERKARNSPKTLLLMKIYIN